MSAGSSPDQTAEVLSKLSYDMILDQGKVSDSIKMKAFVMRFAELSGKSVSDFTVLFSSMVDLDPNDWLGFLENFYSTPAGQVFGSTMVIPPLVRAEGLAAGDSTTPKSAKKDKRSRFLAWQKRLPADHPDKMSEEAIEKKLAWLDQKKKVSFAKSKSTPESVKPSQGSELNSQNTHSQISGTSERLNVVSVSTTQPEKDGQMLKDIGTAVLAVMASQKTGSSSN